MKLTITVNENIGGVLLKGSKVKNRDMFFKIKKDIENIIGQDRLLGSELSYEGYHPFSEEPLHYNIADTIRGSSDLNKLKKTLKNIDGLEIIIDN